MCWVHSVTGVPVKTFEGTALGCLFKRAYMSGIGLRWLPACPPQTSSSGLGSKDLGSDRSRHLISVIGTILVLQVNVLVNELGKPLSLRYSEYAHELFADVVGIITYQTCRN